MNLRWLLLITCVLLGWALAASPPKARAAQDWYEDDSAAQTYARLDYTQHADNQFTNVQLAISRAGAVVFEHRFGPICSYCSIQPIGGLSDSDRSVRVLDLNRDGEPEVLLNFNWGGAHCCFYSYVGYRRTDGQYALKRHLWGDLNYKLRDLNGDGVIELQGVDHRFSYALNASFADSWWPIQIWNFKSGKFVDVTRKHRSTVATDARRKWAGYRRYRGRRDVADVLASYLADTYSLRQSRQGWSRVRRAVRGGALKFPYGPRRSSRGYLRSLKRFLKRTGYAH
jgi:hypothetical protein